MSHLLAINGGNKEIDFEFSRYNSFGDEEAAAVANVMKSGVLSDFIGAPGTKFLGGTKVKEFENALSTKFDCGYSISVNSWSSGLTTIVGALGIEPGDEVLVSPWTMCASATAILHWNAIPIFVDIETDTYCIDPAKLEEQITSRTRAILAIDIFGQSADMNAINAVAKKHNLAVISDTAQAPGALYHGKLAGTLGTVGGYSFNYHKHIHTGEGGMIVTRDSDIADKCQKIRNHAEAVMCNEEHLLPNMVGFNYRMGELEAALGVQQLAKLDLAIASRQRAAQQLNQGLAKLPGLKVPVVRQNCTHVYYFYGLQHDAKKTGVSRDRVYKALCAEGVPFLSNCYQNLHLFPMYQKKIAYGRYGFPWSMRIDRDFDYSRGICPVAEQLNDKSFMGIFMCGSNYTHEEVSGIVNAFHKVYDNLDKL